jgi:hypothetical protein
LRMRGWFKESYRHSLAARGIVSSRYFYRKRPPGSRALRGGRGGPKRPAPEVKSILPAEEQLTLFFIRTLPKDLQQRVRELPSEIEDLSSRRLPLEIELESLRGELAGTVSPELRSLRSQKRQLLARQRALRSSKQTSPQDMLKVQDALEDVSDRLDVLESTGASDDVRVVRERMSGVEGQVRELNAQLRSKRDELDRLTGRGLRKAGLKGSSLPRERVTLEQRRDLLADVESLQSKQELAREVALRKGLQSRDEFVKGIKAKKRAGELSQKDYRQLLRKADSARDLLQTDTVFGDVKELPLERFPLKPRRVTKLTPAIIPLPKKVIVEDRALQRASDRRERALRSKRVESEADAMLKQLQKEGSIPKDSEDT